VHAHFIGVVQEIAIRLQGTGVNMPDEFQLTGFFDGLFEFGLPDA
jgi:hypothetical protein